MILPADLREFGRSSDFGHGSAHLSQVNDRSIREAAMTTRRTLLTGAAALMGGALAAPALSQGRQRLRMVTAWPKDLPGVGVGAQRLADRIGELTEGRLTVSVHPVGELVRGQDNMDAVMDGTADMSHDLSTYYLGKSPAFAFFSSVPFGLVAGEHNAWIQHGGGQALWDELGRRYGVKAFLAGNLGAQLGGWFRKEISSARTSKVCAIVSRGSAARRSSASRCRRCCSPGTPSSSRCARTSSTRQSSWGR